MTYLPLSVVEITMMYAIVGDAYQADELDKELDKIDCSVDSALTNWASTDETTYLYITFHPRIDTDLFDLDLKLRTIFTKLMFNRG